jgi:hypothetical protein
VNYIIGQIGKCHTRFLSGPRKWYDNLAMTSGNHALSISKSPTARVDKIGEGSWHLEIPANPKSGYRLAQLDDHRSVHRHNFPWQPPLKLKLQARVSAQELPGTWGFGLWNDPFSFLLSYNKVAARFPTLPDAAWFFYASTQNYLSFRDDLPASGFLTATFSSKKIPSVILALASPILALTLIPRTAQAIRKLIRRVVHQDASLIHTDVTEWHEYTMEWDAGQVKFCLDGEVILQTGITPSGPLSLVIWVDNQYAALPPHGRVRYGTLPNPEPAWMEIRDLSLEEKV